MKSKVFQITRSYFDRINSLPKEVQLEIWTATMEYHFNDKKIELSKLGKSFFELLKPDLEKRRVNQKNGALGAAERERRKAVK